MEQVIFSAHAKIQMIERGASKKEVIAAVYDGEKILLNMAGLHTEKISSIITSGEKNFIILNK